MFYKKRFISILMLFVLMMITAFPQTSPFSTYFESINSGISEDNPNSQTMMAFQHTVQVEGTSFMRFAFSDYNLGEESFIRFSVPGDTLTYDMNQAMIENFDNSTPIFNGNEVTLTLYHYPGDKNIFFLIDSMLVSNNEWAFECTEGAFCDGADSRVSDVSQFHKAIGRLYGNGTAWISSNHKVVTALHVIKQGIPAGWTQIIEFNVPQSQLNGEPIFAHPDDQYVVGEISASGGSAQGENDWAIINVLPKYLNSYTIAYYAWERQGVSLNVKQNFLDYTNTQVSGYGCSYNRVRNKTLLAANGQAWYYMINNKNYIRFTVDVSPGTSGAPIIDLTDGTVIGIATTPSCSSVGYNTGISLKAPQFWNALEGGVRLTKVQQLDAAGNPFPLTTTFGWWKANQFEAQPNNAMIKLKIDSIEALKANSNLISNQKYYKWDFISNYLNHSEFYFSNQLPRTLFAYFRNSVQNITLQTIGLEFNGNIPIELGFSDPWYEDFNDSKGVRNRGENSIFHSYVSPFALNDHGSYKGVFLDQGLFWIAPLYHVYAPGTINVMFPPTSRMHYFHFYNWSASPVLSVEFYNANNNQTALIFKQDNTSIAALYKGTQLSNNQETYSNNGQQHFVRVKNDYLYSAYESMGKLFIEKTLTDGTWMLLNNGKPIIQEQVFSSSMDFLNNGTNEDDKLMLALTSQSGGYPILGTLLLNGYTDEVIANDYIWQSDNMHTPSELQPIVAVNGSSKFMLVFRRIDSDKKGLFFCPGSISDNTLSIADSSGYPWYIHGTNQYSVNPTISVSKTAANEPVYWIAWQQNSPSGSSSDIYYSRLLFTQTAHSLSMAE